MRDREDSSGLLAGISVPTLIIVGDEDVLTPPREARRMHEAIPGSRLEIIAGAGHLSNLERPMEFNRVATEFIEGLIDGRVS
jgi:3-oxoadipate enol-lactonase